MKSGQLIEYNMRNVVLEKLYSECVGEASRRHFYKELKLYVFLNQQSEML